MQQYLHKKKHKGDEVSAAVIINATSSQECSYILLALFHSQRKAAAVSGNKKCKNTFIIRHCTKVV